MQQAFIAFAPAAVMIPAGMLQRDRLSDVGGQAAVVLHASQYVGTILAGLAAYIWLELTIRKQKAIPNPTDTPASKQS